MPLAVSPAAIGVALLPNPLESLTIKRKEARAAKRTFIAVLTLSCTNFVCALVAVYTLQAAVSSSTAVAYSSYTLAIAMTGFTGSALLLSPYTIFQRVLLKRMPTLRHVISQLWWQITRMSQQTIRYRQENDRLQAKVQQLNHVKDQLAKVVKKDMGGNMQDLMNLVHENGQIQREIKSIQDAAAIQELLQTILRSDVNQDGIMSEAEIEQLQVRLQCQSTIPIDPMRLQYMLTRQARDNVNNVSVTNLFDRIMDVDTITCNAADMQSDYYIDSTSYRDEDDDWKTAFNYTQFVV